MRRERISIVAAVILAVSFTAVCAASEGGKKPLKAKTKEEIINEAKDELNSTVWQIELKPMATGKKGENKGKTDTLRFENNKVASDRLASSGFGPSNYTIRLKGADNDIVVWETMQASEEEGVAFWRGQIHNDVMRGVLSWHVDEKNKKDYNFVSKGEKERIATPEPAEGLEAAAVQATEEEDIEKMAEEPAVQEEEEPLEKSSETASEPEQLKTEKAPQKIKKRWWEK